MKQLAFLPYLFLLFSSCTEKEVTKTDLLTSKVWTNPVIIKGPPIGYEYKDGCNHDYQFQSNGKYSHYSGNCNKEYWTGNWSWIKKGSEIHLETFFKDIPQRTFRIKIIELSDTLLHTEDIVEGPDSIFAYEKKYSVR